MTDHCPYCGNPLAHSRAWNNGRRICAFCDESKLLGEIVPIEDVAEALTQALKDDQVADAFRAWIQSVCPPEDESKLLGVSKPLEEILAPSPAAGPGLANPPGEAECVSGSGEGGATSSQG